jgi:AGCS family alanine or glycine:cation symporter
MGFLLALIILAVTIKGVKSIGKFTSIVMPIMGSLYLLIALVIVVLNIEKTGQVYALIFNGAFGVKQIVGGIGGYTIIKAMQLGVRRGVFSNEAGIGSASFSAASSNSKHPIQQGLLQSLSTFLDTIIICSASAFIILYSGA